jgi:hypothetical protein
VDEAEAMRFEMPPRGQQMSQRRDPREMGGSTIDAAGDLIVATSALRPTENFAPSQK